MSLNSKLGDPSQNSYVTATQANDYFTNRYDTDEWDALATTTKEGVLVEAARMLEWFNYSKSKYYDSQGLSLPFEDHEIVTGNCATPAAINSFKHDNLKSVTYNDIPSNYWKYGSVHITAGTPLNEIRLIESSNVTTGSIVVTENFSTTCNATTEFIVFAPVSDAIQHAQCEQAIFILQNSSLKMISRYRDHGTKYVRIGDAAVSYHENVAGKILMSPAAKKLLSAFIDKNYKIGRA